MPHVAHYERVVDKNSLAALASLHIGRRQEQVLAAIVDLHRDGLRPCDQDLAVYLRLPINSVGSRRNELVAAKLVERGGDKRGPFGRIVGWWRPAPVQLSLFSRTAL